jgi:hypothetical protein
MPTPAEEIAWAAGLFEGEGCMTVSGGQPMMRLNSTDEDTPQRFCEIVAAGKVYGPYRRPPPRKPVWIWVAYGIDAMLTVQLIGPWFGERRRRRAKELFGTKYVP